MSPFVYQRRWEQGKSGPKTSAMAFGKELLQARVASSIAFAFIFFAASSVLGITLVAHAEISTGEYAAVLPVHHVAMVRQSAVLGMETSSMPEQGNFSFETTNMSVSYTPLDFDSSTGLWNYIIEYTIPQLDNGVIVAGKRVIGTGAGSNDIVETGYVLKPGSNNEISFLNKTGNKTAKLLTVMITAQAKPADEVLDCQSSDSCGHEQSMPPKPLPQEQENRK